MIFLMLTILEALTKNRLALKTQTIHYAWICFLRIAQDTLKIHPQSKLESQLFRRIDLFFSLNNKR